MDLQRGVSMRRSAMHPLCACRPGTRAALLAGLLLAACGESVVPFAPATGADATGMFWALTLNHRAVTLSTVAPYDTIALVATPRDARGTPLEGLGTVTYTSSDPARVEVSADGHVRAHLSVQGVTVAAALTVGNVRHADTVTFVVTDEPAPPTPAHLSIHPQLPDSATWSLNGDGSFLNLSGNGSAGFSNIKVLFGSGTDAQGTPIPGLNLAFSSSDTAVARVLGFGPVMVLQPLKPGRATLVASTTAYGVALADTVQFTITMPVLQAVKIQPRQVSLGGPDQITFGSADVTVAPGGTVLWLNLSGKQVDVVFDDPTNVVEHGAINCANLPEPPGGGNIPAFGVPQDSLAPTLDAENCRSRRFPVQGVYPYHSSITGAMGRVVVNDGLSAP
jgi:plastocyanin